MADDRNFFAYLPAGASLRAALPPGTHTDAAEGDRVIEVATARGEARHYFARALTAAEREAYQAARPVVETFPGTTLGQVKDDGYQGPCRKGGCGKPLLAPLRPPAMVWALPARRQVMAHYMDQPEKTEEERQRERAERAEEEVRRLRKRVGELETALRVLQEVARG